jgi:mannose-6-phosphate isomerase
MTDVIELECKVLNYEWGKIGCSSIISNLIKFDESLKFDENEKYAELWMGTHKKAESKILHTNIRLSDWIKNNTTLKKLPFLFKVLSIKKALSIQAHPDKKLAQKLHKNNPEIYQDDNHKPEMVIALTTFECLCGFKDIESIKINLENVSELKDLIGNLHVERFINGDIDLKSIFTIMMKSDTYDIEKYVKKLNYRLRISSHSNSDTVAFKLSEQFPGDVGVFCSYFLNYLHLNPGDSLFISSGLPHSYLSGDCVECMSCSDNVIRAGLTEKFKDIDTLCNMLDYSSNKQFIINPIYKSENGLIELDYKLDIEEFNMRSYEISSIFHNLGYVNGPSIIIVLSGNGNICNINVSPGSVLFIAPYTEIVAVNSNTLKIFQAYC